MDREVENITERLHRCGSNFTLSKLTMDNRLKDLWRRESQGSSEFTEYDRCSGTRSRTDRFYTE